MTPEELLEVSAEIRKLWSSAAQWRDPSDFYPRFARMPAAAVRRAVDDVFEEGSRYAPSPSELAAAARGYVVGDRECRHMFTTHIGPSNIGSPYLLSDGKGPGLLSCAGCGRDQGTCACELCRQDPRFDVRAS